MKVRTLFRRPEAEPGWEGRTVLVGALRTAEQLDVALCCGFYHIPLDLLGDAEGITHVAIYQSHRFFGNGAGIWWYGRVKKSLVLPRRAIREIPKDSDIAYLRLEVERWLPLPRPILPGAQGLVAEMTTLYQLLHSRELAQMLLEGPEEFFLYDRLWKLCRRRLSLGYGRCGPYRVRLAGRMISLRRGRGRPVRFPAADFRTAPGKTLENALIGLNHIRR